MGKSWDGHQPARSVRRRALQLVVESLEQRFLMSVTASRGDLGNEKSGPLSRVGTALASVWREYDRFVASGKSASTFTGIDRMLFTRSGAIAIEAYTQGKSTDLEVAVRALKATNVKCYQNSVYAMLPIDQIDDLSRLPGLTFARPAWARTNVGSVTSQGDAAIRADIARTTSGFNGSGVTVGVMSDSFNNLGGYSSDVTGGDLPAGVNVVQDMPSGGSDEGRAMAQLVHDSAPGASLAFATAFIGGQGGFASNIAALAGAGADVIVDDVIYFAEPMFQDGVIAQAVDGVVSGGVSYFSSAGNDARKAYEAPFRDGVPRLDGDFTSAGGAPHFFGGLTHDFDPGAGVDDLQAFTLASGQAVTLSFQWAQPYGSVPGSASSAIDLDIYVLDSTGTQVVGGSATNNAGPGLDPIEVFQFVNTTGSTQTFNFLITRFLGVSPVMLKYVNFDTHNGVEYDTASGTSYGHANAAGAAGVGAARYASTPAFGVTPPVIESFSSAGGTPIYYSATGTLLGASVTRQRPNFTAPDGGNTSFFFGDDDDADSFPNFYGTSAAAPTAAAVAALMLDANASLAPTQIYTALQNTALDMDDPGTGGFDAGFDYRTGYGLIRADAAVASVAGSSISGQVFHDFNANSTLDGGETTQNVVTVYIDANNNGVLDASSISQSSSDVPKSVPDPGTTTSDLLISGLSGLITDVNVTLSITHTWDEDLDVFLISPTGARVELVTDAGLDSDNFNNTTFDDEAATGILFGAAPFTGTFKPEGLLSALDGLAPNGTWKLEVSDDLAVDSGTLTAWSITIASSERTTVTAGAGDYSFTDLALGTYVIREVVPATFVALTGVQTINVVAPGSSFTAVNFANIATIYTGSVADDDFLIRRNVAGTAHEILISNVIIYTVPVSVSMLTFNLGAGDDRLSVDYVNGSPVPAGGIAYDGQTHDSGGDTLTILGTSAAETVSFSTASVSLSGTITHSGVETVKFDGKLGLDHVAVNTAAAVTFPATQRLASLIIANSAVVTLAQGASRVIHTDAISLTGSAMLDLGDNDLLVNYTGSSPLGSFNGSSYTGLTGLVASARGDGTWNGSGISTTQSNATAGAGYTMLGIAEASDAFGLGPTDTMLYGAETLDATTVVVKYTYGGDANLSGNVDVDDYGQIDFNATAGGVLTGWFNGDFDFSGLQDVDDYGIIDFVVNVQAAPL